MFTIFEISIYFRLHQRTYCSISIVEAIYTAVHKLLKGPVVPMLCFSPYSQPYLHHVYNTQHMNIKLYISKPTNQSTKTKQTLHCFNYNTNINLNYVTVNLTCTTAYIHIYTHISTSTESFKKHCKFIIHKLTLHKQTVCHLER